MQNSECRIREPIEDTTNNSAFSILHSALPPQPAVEMDDIWFKYDKKSPDVIKGLSFSANYGQVTTILGGNGTGKTTALSLIAGHNTAYRGKVSSGAAVYMLPQDPQTLFTSKTVREDLLEVLSGRNLQKEEIHRRLAAMVKLCSLEAVLNSHPYDLSGGEQQRAALAKVLLLQPKILLLDEPTKGLDAEFKLTFAAILKKLTKTGVAIVMASHDVEFCALHADRCALFFDGSIVTSNTPRAFFSGNSFYTTSANRMAREYLPEAITAGDIILALGGQLPPAREIPDFDDPDDTDADDLPPPQKKTKLSKLRASVLAVLILCLLVTTVIAGVYFEGFRAFISGGDTAITASTEGGVLYTGIIIALSLELVCIAIVYAWNREKKQPEPRLKLHKQKLSKRTVLAAVIVLITIPLTILVGMRIFDDRRYYFISMLIIFQTMLPFALVFEGRKPQARELVIIAVLCAIGVTGRFAFFMLPQFKPVIALVIIAGVAFGGEAGFLVGAMTILVSNIMFQQGPWTPWQMFAAGIIGFLAGIVFRRGSLGRSRIALCIFGGMTTFAIYGGIMNPAQVMIYQGSPTPAMFIAAYLQGIPVDLVHAAATIFFLAIISQPMLEKLDRIKLKYGLIE